MKEEIIIKKQLIKEREWLDRLIIKAESRIKLNTMTDERPVRISKRKNGYQYYLEESSGRRIYVKRENLEPVRKRIQKDYDMAVFDKLTDLRSQIDKFIKSYDTAAVANEYERLCEARKNFVEPIMPTDEEFIKQWEKRHVGGMNPFPKEGQYYTERGECVRSKSEKILADMFNKFHIPYAYEPCVNLMGGYTVYPDFVLLNVKERRTIYWEHFGLASNGDYSVKALQKLRQYESSGLEPGQDLLFSVESDNMPLDVKGLEEKIRKNLLG
ncbi:MAG: hypothetical protein K6G72_03030 [Lachnospiraceae bacterium]|nr:hypothetical protein [Lachnospiraceae bacterium]